MPQTMHPIESWGKSLITQSQIKNWDFIQQIDSVATEKVLAVGQHLSYGDVCHNDGGTVLNTHSLDCILQFDQEKGIIEVEAGVTLGKILEFIVPQGWFLSVVPGTKLISVGGAIANDIHGKNHHQEGSLGNFVLELKLLRSDGQILTCSREENSQYFTSTIAGLGLTGVILSATLQLKKIQSSFLEVQYIKFWSFDQYLKLNEESLIYPYTVSWLDCLNGGSQRSFRGIYMRGHFSQKNILLTTHPHKVPLTVPFNFPSLILNQYSMKCFNSLYFNKQWGEKKSFLQHYDSFFFPLDCLKQWNKIYGRKGFFQFQCLIPFKKPEIFFKILKKIYLSQQGSFLSVLKSFGHKPSPGIMSFPREGLTLCLDFPNRGEKTARLFRELNQLVLSSEGSLYPAKDSFMQPEEFLHFFPHARNFNKLIDKRFSSSFWKRVFPGSYS